MVAHDAVILAGGAARRLGGALKPQVTVRGRRLLDHVLDATTEARGVVVVAPDAVPVPAHVTRTLEDPPLGGPVAGIAAGLDALAEPGAPWVLLLACDLPGAADAVPRLLAGAGAMAGTTAGVGNSADLTGEGDGEGVVMEGVVMTDGEGRRQWLLGLYRAAAVRARVADLGPDVRGASVRALLSPLRLTEVPARGEESHDVDTWADRGDP